MNRRDFLKGIAAAGVVGAIAPSLLVQDRGKINIEPVIENFRSAPILMSFDEKLKMMSSSHDIYAHLMTRCPSE
jgi:hypothetical protein